MHTRPLLTETFLSPPPSHHVSVTFASDATALVAVTDWSCKGSSYGTRIDDPAVLSWIRSWM